MKISCLDPFFRAFDDICVSDRTKVDLSFMIFLLHPKMISVRPYMAISFTTH